MFFQFFDELRAARIPVTLKEYLVLMEALDQDVIEMKVDDFYYLSRAALVKDEKQPRQVRPGVRPCVQGPGAARRRRMLAHIPAEWLKALTEKFLTEEEKKQIEAHGRLRQADGDAEAAHRGTEEAPREAATRRSAPAAPRPSAPTATTPKASASARTRAATARRSRSGTSASTRTSTTASSSAPATSRWRCAACANGRARARPDELDMNGTIKDTANKGYLDIDHAARAPQHHQGAAVLRHRRLDG